MHLFSVSYCHLHAQFSIEFPSLWVTEDRTVIMLGRYTLASGSQANDSRLALLCHLQESRRIVWPHISAKLKSFGGRYTREHDPLLSQKLDPAIEHSSFTSLGMCTLLVSHFLEAAQGHASKIKKKVLLHLHSLNSLNGVVTELLRLVVRGGKSTCLAATGD